MKRRTTPEEAERASRTRPESAAHSIDEAANPTSVIALQATSGWSTKMNRIRVRRSNSSNSQTAAITAPPSFTGVVNPIDCNPVVRSKNVRTTKTARAAPRLTKASAANPAAKTAARAS